MALDKFYRYIIILLIILQVTWFFVPWGFAYHDGAMESLVWLGANSLIGSRDFIILYSNAITILYIVSYIGLFFFSAIFRAVFMSLVIGGGLAVPLFGLRVESGYESMLSYFMSIGDGVVLSMIYFSDIKKLFRRRI